ncbi:hypothetical protein N8I74_15775 [Chitiniphilus purpureus]|uniref:Uncharacterized protein n=1 Tax=Chitiniphilus purpureus TaxID=2981137 RepID=A0ABY6DL42_9NEIS|nr:hypothetical protein [Chitiniphilus sp. CD1]UXY14762.1 hypothetical protein N8I74_15775 [Chitiniphilus sp. CD1]
MSDRKTQMAVLASSVTVTAAMPADCAAGFVTAAAKEGVPTEALIGYCAIKSAFGALDPRVVEFEKAYWPMLGHMGER